ncbi:MAG TPA: hypothetical protein VG367_11090 [Mucilaginibacter sp.]|nr:hypothetical protein [Mucilaginibacter sp.]
MKKIKYIILGIIIAGLSSCGIFKKDCGCPHFGKNIPASNITSPRHYA